MGVKLDALIKEVNKKAKESGAYSVYVHVSPNEKLYFGITHDTLYHRSGSSGVRYKRNKHFWSAIQKYGWNNFQHIVLVNNISQSDACELEQYLINKYHTNNPDFGYNQSVGGEKTALGNHLSDETKEKIRQFQLGRKKSDETKQKLSDAHKGKVKGALSADHKQKLSVAMTGRKLSVETRQKISNAGEGIQFSDAHKQKLSDAKRGRKLSEAHKQKIRESMLKVNRGGNVCGC